MGNWLLRTVLVLLASPAIASAQSSAATLEQRLTPEEMHATGLDTLSPAQLRLLNQALQRSAAEDSCPATAPVASAGAPVQEASKSIEPAIATPQPDPAPRAEPTAPMFIGLNDEPVNSRVVGVVSGWEPGTEFALENGQRWKVLKGELTLHSPLSNPSITVIPGIAGRWFLQVDENLPSARVYRIE